MSAPRLLDKKVINASLAQERKQEIDKGTKLTESVLALREANVAEKERLEETRSNGLKLIQIELDAKAKENEELSKRNRFLKEERIRLEGPIDLVEAWNEVHLLTSENLTISDNLLSREIDVTARENDLIDGQRLVIEREKAVERAEINTSQALIRAQAEREEAMQTNETAQALMAKTEVKRIEQEKHFKETAEELEQREIALEAREEEIEEQEIALTNEKILLADRRATLDRGFAELRRRQANT